MCMNDGPDEIEWRMGAGQQPGIPELWMAQAIHEETLSYNDIGMQARSCAPIQVEMSNIKM